MLDVIVAEKVQAKPDSPAKAIRSVYYRASVIDRQTTGVKKPQLRGCG
tara:strand:+ start:394 stop:537 length:144 start_codon:yes stop_codon:yes gene_type:complete